MDTCCEISSAMTVRAIQKTSVQSFTRYDAEQLSRIENIPHNEPQNISECLSEKRKILRKGLFSNVTLCVIPRTSF